MAGIHTGLFADAGIDMSRFSQILDMDDGDSEREFSKNTVFTALNNYGQGLEQMVDALKNGDLEKVSGVAGMMKRTAEPLGFTLIEQNSGYIEKLGKGKDEETGGDLDRETCQARISKLLPTLTIKYAEVDRAIRSFYDE